MEAASSAFFRSSREELNQNQMIQRFHPQQPPSLEQPPPPPTATASPPPKKKRNQPGNPNPDSEVIALSPKTLMATNRFICEVCGKGFQREQNLQLHGRGHNLPWKLKQKTNKEPRKKVYLCPEPSCVHHDPSRALGDLTGIKKHFYRKHGEKKWNCEKCSKKYAVRSDWKAHSKTCGTREYRCECGTVFSRRDSFVTHKAFCDTLAQETAARNRTCLNAPHLYGTCNIGFSTQLNRHHLSSVQDLTHPPSNNIPHLRAGAPIFEYLNPPSSIQPIQTSTFSLSNNDNDDDNNNSNINDDQSHQSLCPNKPLQALMQLPNLHAGNPNHSSSSFSDLFNLGFFSSEASNSGMDTAASSSGFLNSNNYNVPSSLSSVYPIQPENMAAHLSATALLQKAAQVGSSTSNSVNNSASPAAEAKAFNQTLMSSHIENEQSDSLKGFMNSFASCVGGNGHDGGSFGGFGGCNLDKGKLPKNLSTPNIGGSDILTVDFLGVGGMMRNMGEMLEHEVRSAEASSQWIGNNKLSGDI